MLCVFFFQAEDGIRDLVRSRGLGDVYKRQGLADAVPLPDSQRVVLEPGQQVRQAAGQGAVDAPVSYTHLTLPTSDLA